MVAEAGDRTAADVLREPDEQEEVDASPVQAADELEADVESDEDEVAQAEPASGPRSHSDGEVRAKLTALRIEVEGFLDELESSEHP